ncbi:MAG: hypothetical protein U0325_23670 [Polyangiales bacterium]
MSASVSSPARAVSAAYALWGAAALAVAVSGALASLPAPAVPVLIWSPVVLSVVAWRRLPAVRDFADAIDLRVAVLGHVGRVLFGALFLWEMRAGRLPASFAMLAGPGDIAAGLLAMPAAWLVTRGDRASRTLVRAWNLLALVDILAVFVSAQRMLFVERDLRFFALMRTLPYATLPVLVVPLILLTHLLVMQRLGAARR